MTYTFKDIAKELNITETQAKAKLKKAGYALTAKLDEGQFKLLIAQSESKALPQKKEINPTETTEKAESKVETVTLQSLATEDIPLENLIEIAGMLQLDVNAISPVDADLLIKLVQDSIQLNKIQQESEKTKKQREEIKSKAFQLELESAQLNGELNALLISKVGEMSYEKRLLELEKGNLRQLESRATDFQSQLLKLMPKDDVIDVEVEKEESPFLKLGKARLKLLRGV